VSPFLIIDDELIMLLFNPLSRKDFQLEQMLQLEIEGIDEEESNSTVKILEDAKKQNY
jgi:hypothetical protein